MSAGSSQQEDSKLPVPIGFKTWNAYWTEHEMPWRTEPEIDEERQRYLAARRGVKKEVRKGISAFKDVKLCRADLEWLIAVAPGPIDLTFADLRGADLTGLPLDGINLSAAQLDEADLQNASLRRANLAFATLTDANLSKAHLEGAQLISASADGADFSDAHLEGASLGLTRLERASFAGAYLEGADLSRARLDEALLLDAHLLGANLAGASLHRAHLGRARLHGITCGALHTEVGDTLAAKSLAAQLKARLYGVTFSRRAADIAYETGTNLEGAYLGHAHLEGYHVPPAVLARISPWVSNFPEDLPAADLHGASLDVHTALEGAVLSNDRGEAISVADVRWGGVNLAVVNDWRPDTVLGDERAAWASVLPKRRTANRRRNTDTKRSRTERAKARLARRSWWHYAFVRAVNERLDRFRAAVRANRQLATALREQGMNEEADRFAYRAQVCQRQVFRLTHQRVRAAFSWLLDAISGHGYQPAKTLAWYLGILAVFACAYFAATHGVLTFGLPPSQIQPLPWYEALVLSVSSFHGRGFFQPVQSLGDPVAILAAIEAVFGLFIEVSFIATFTQRYFGK